MTRRQGSGQKPEHTTPQVVCPRQDSNLRTRLRRAVLYPLSYGGSRASRHTVPGGIGRLSNAVPVSFGRVLHRPPGARRRRRRRDPSARGRQPRTGRLRGAHRGRRRGLSRARP
ncbi:hypothetical protein FRAHR75_240054 [Frankia sp. Hr75.2]|nr:hypothetical protein FRAHR75_240054 [Frankia sp. Hr75.2]